MTTESKPLCKYGVKCFRKNQKHLDDFNHNIEKETMKIDKIENSDLIIQADKDKENVENRRESLEKNPPKKRRKSDEDLNRNVEKIDLTTIKDIKDLVKEYNKMGMPDDFYELIDFCKSLDPKNPKNALETIGIELAGVYDLVLLGLKLDYKMHSRYFYDPPEFQTVLRVKDSDSLLHFGYFRDDPSEMPSFVAINEANIDGKIISKGDNLFSAINWYIEELLSKKTYSSYTSDEKLNKFKSKFSKWCDENHKNDKQFSLLLKTPKIKSREKKVNCKTIHQAGIVVPMNSRGFGYREVPETLEKQKKMFANSSVKDELGPNKAKKSKGEDDIEEIITLIQFANDETDYGMGLEFGLNMFSFGELNLHKYIKSTLPVCYTLLDRKLYAEIVREHLKNRKLNP